MANKTSQKYSHGRILTHVRVMRGLWVTRPDSSKDLGAL